MNDTTRAAIRMALTYIEHHSGVIDDEEDCPHPLAIREALCAELVKQQAEPTDPMIAAQLRVLLADMNADNWIKKRAEALDLMLRKP